MWGAAESDCSEVVFVPVRLKAIDVRMWVGPLRLPQAFSAEGHPLLLLSRRVEPMVALGLPHALCEAVDITKRPQVEAAVAKAEAEYGPVDCFVRGPAVPPPPAMRPRMGVKHVLLYSPLFAFALWVLVRGW